MFLSPDCITAVMQKTLQSLLLGLSRIFPEKVYLVKPFCIYPLYY